MLEILKFSCSGFFTFIGSISLIYVILYMAINGTTTMLRLFFRHLNIIKHGWPPDYLDADGDIHKIK